MTQNEQISRKDFFRRLGNLTAGAAALSLFPWLEGCSPENERMAQGEKARLGVIGTGSRGMFHLAHLIQDPSASIVALCDDYAPHLEQAAALFPTPDATRTTAGCWKTRKWTGSSSAPPSPCMPP